MPLSHGVVSHFFVKLRGPVFRSSVKIRHMNLFAFGQPSPFEKTSFESVFIGYAGSVASGIRQTPAPARCSTKAWQPHSLKRVLSRGPAIICVLCTLIRPAKHSPLRVD